jgi:hypothetical protein
MERHRYTFGPEDRQGQKIACREIACEIGRHFRVSGEPASRLRRSSAKGSTDDNDDGDGSEGGASARPWIAGLVTHPGRNLASSDAQEPSGVLIQPEIIKAGITLVTVLVTNATRKRRCSGRESRSWNCKMPEVGALGFSSSSAPSPPQAIAPASDRNGPHEGSQAKKKGPDVLTP